MTTRRFTVDTNVLVEAHDLAVPARQALAESFLRAAATADCTLTLQAIGEFYRAATRKLSAAPAKAAAHARGLMTTFPLTAPSAVALERALDAAEKGRFSLWDAYLLATADEAGCTTCFSLDMHDSAKLGGITIRRPYDANGLTSVAQALIGS